MERTPTPTLIRPQEVALPISPTEWSEISPPSSDGRLIAPSKRSFLGRILNEGSILYLVAFGLYLTVAVLLDMKYRTFNGDAVSRMANGFYILYSRDEHLAAIGFVWEPLQSMADMVFLLGNHLWPALSHNDMAGSLVSALSMAGAAYQILSALREWGVTRVPRLVLTVFFALNPMIVFYGGNGMSEGLYLFTLTASTRYVLRWMRDGDIRSLAYAGVALGFSYLTRNEAAGGAVAGVCAVGLVSYFRTQGVRPSRIRTAMSDSFIFGIPVFVAAAGWAITSFIITGSFFGQLSSIYGNSSQESYLQHKSFHGRVVFELQALDSLAPLLVIVLLASILVAVKRRDPRIMAPLAVLGGALGFDMLAFLDNTIENFFRYWIVAVPLEVLLVGGLLAAVQAPSRDENLVKRSAGWVPRLLRALAAIGLAIVVMLPATVTTGAAMFNPKIGSEQVDALGFIFHSHPNANDIQWKDRYPHILALGSYFSSLHLPDGDIVTDNFDVCLPQLLTTISQPKLFVIPNDRDFERILADPITFHTHYILEANPAQVPNTSINIEYPRLWDTGAGFTKLVRKFPSESTCPAYRLFRGAPSFR